MKQEKKSINIIIGTNIQNAREKAGITQEKLSEQIGIGTKSLSAIERGTVGISLAALKRVCERLSVTSDSLIFGVLEDSKRDEEIRGISEQLAQMSHEEFRIAKDIFMKVQEALRVNKDEEPER